MFLRNILGPTNIENYSNSYYKSQFFFNFVQNYKTVFIYYKWLLRRTVRLFESWVLLFNIYTQKKLGIVPFQLKVSWSSTKQHTKTKYFKPLEEKKQMV